LGGGQNRTAYTTLRLAECWRRNTACRHELVGVAVVGTAVGSLWTTKVHAGANRVLVGTLAATNAVADDARSAADGSTGSFSWLAGATPAIAAAGVARTAVVDVVRAARPRATASLRRRWRTMAGRVQSARRVIETAVHTVGVGRVGTFLREWSSTHRRIGER